jgi:hypothetical protein
MMLIFLEFHRNETFKMGIAYGSQNAFRIIFQRVKTRCYKMLRAYGSQNVLSYYFQRIKIRCYKMLRAYGSIKKILT